MQLFFLGWLMVILLGTGKGVVVMGLSEERRQSFLFGQCVGGVCTVLTTGKKVRHWRRQTLRSVPPDHPQQRQLATTATEKVAARQTFRSGVLLNSLSTMHYRASLDTVRPSWFLLGIFLGDALFVSLEKWCLGQDIRRWLIHVPTENDKILYQNELKSIEFQITFLLICSFIALPSVQFLPDPTDGFKWKRKLERPGTKFDSEPSFEKPMWLENLVEWFKKIRELD